MPFLHPQRTRCWRRNPFFVVRVPAEFEYQTLESWSRPRRVYIQLSSAYPRPDLFRLCHARLMQLVAADG